MVGDFPSPAYPGGVIVHGSVLKRRERKTGIPMKGVHEVVDEVVERKTRGLHSPRF